MRAKSYFRNRRNDNRTDRAALNTTGSMQPGGVSPEHDEREGDHRHDTRANDHDRKPTILNHPKAIAAARPVLNC